MRTFRSILSRPLLSKRMCSTTTTSTGGAAGDGDMGKVASSVLGNFSNTTVPTIGQHHINTPSFASRLKEATEMKDDRLVTSISGELDEDESFSTPARQGVSSSSSTTTDTSFSSSFANTVKLRTSEKPFSQRLALRVNEVLGDASNVLSQSLQDADLATEDIRIATTVVNLKTTLQSNFPIFLLQPISALHLTHICSALVNIHLTALRPEHSFNLINQREQQMPAFALLGKSEEESAPSQGSPIVRGGFGTQANSYFPKPVSNLSGSESNSSLGSRGGEGESVAQASEQTSQSVMTRDVRHGASARQKKVHLVVSVATAIVDEAFSLTTCKVHADRDNAGLTLLWLTYLHKMSMVEGSTVFEV